MTPLIVDASVAVSWCVQDEVSAHSPSILRRVFEAGAFVPQHWKIEVCNALLMLERDGRISQSEHYREWLEIEALPIEVRPTSVPASVSLARLHDLTVYDALYLQLAIRTGLELATLDKALLRAAKAAGVKTVQTA